ncbi:hypothetical protein JCM16163A_11740 [Paenibacillus sp. YK5]
MLTHIVVSIQSMALVQKTELSRDIYDAAGSSILWQATLSGTGWLYLCCLLFYFKNWKNI